jgi:hypothetical protein
LKRIGDDGKQHASPRRRADSGGNVDFPSRNDDDANRWDPQDSTAADDGPAALRSLRRREAGVVALAPASLSLDGGPAGPAGLVRRQQQQQPQEVVLIPTSYSNQNSGPTPGTVIGVVLGSVAGFLLLLWLIRTLVNRGSAGATVEEDDIVVRERRTSRSSRSRNSRSSPPRPRTPVRRSATETRVVDEQVIIEDSRVAAGDDEDVVEVIEEEEELRPPRRSRSGRGRADSGYRPVEPDRFAGGNHPMEQVYVPRSRRR